MFHAIIKINKYIQLEYVYDKENLRLRLLFKFNCHNPNWLFLNLDLDVLNKLKTILNKLLPL